MSLFAQIYDYENLYEAYNKARRSRRYRREALQFGALLEENIINIQNHLIWRSYVSGEMAYPFIDRVIETAVINVITPIFKLEDITTDNNALKLTIRRKIKCEGTLWLIETANRTAFYNNLTKQITKRK